MQVTRNRHFEMCVEGVKGKFTQLSYRPPEVNMKAQR